EVEDIAWARVARLVRGGLFGAPRMRGAVAGNGQQGRRADEGTFHLNPGRSVVSMLFGVSAGGAFGAGGFWAGFFSVGGLGGGGWPWGRGTAALGLCDPRRRALTVRRAGVGLVHDSLVEEQRADPVARCPLQVRAPDEGR